MKDLDMYDYLLGCWFFALILALLVFCVIAGRNLYNQHDRENPKTVYVETQKAVAWFYLKK